MNTLTRPLTWIAAAALTVASLPAMALEPFKADYLASYMGMQANGTMTLSSEGANKWRYSLQVKNQLADLSQSIAGKPQTDLTEPRLVEVLEQIVAGCRKRKLIAGIHVASPAYGAEIINVAPSTLDATSEEIKLVKVELYTEKMKFTYKG